MIDGKPMRGKNRLGRGYRVQGFKLTEVSGESGRQHPAVGFAEGLLLWIQNGIFDLVEYQEQDRIRFDSDRLGVSLPRSTVFLGFG